MIASPTQVKQKATAVYVLVLATLMTGTPTFGSDKKLVGKTIIITHDLDRICVQSKCSKISYFQREIEFVYFGAEGTVYIGGVKRDDNGLIVRDRDGGYRPYPGGKICSISGIVSSDHQGETTCRMKNGNGQAIIDVAIANHAGNVASRGTQNYVIHFGGEKVCSFSRRDENEGGGWKSISEYRSVNCEITEGNLFKQ